MPAHCQRSATIEAIRRSSVHRSIATPSSRAAMARARNSILTDPYESLDLLRKLLQEDINKKLGYVMQEFVKDYFGPAVENMRQNLLGHQIQGNSDDPSYCSHHWLENVCCDALEHAKLAFRNINSFKKIDLDNIKGQMKPANDTVTTIKVEAASSPGTIHPQKRKSEQLSKNPNVISSSSTLSASMEYVPPAKKKNGKKQISRGSPTATISTTTKAAVSSSIDNAGDTILITKQGKPVRREGFKWNPDRLKSDETLFVLGSRANKALGLGGPGRARLYTKHPDLFKYSIKDREDKEWLGKQSGLVPAGSSVGGKACYVMVLQDILELAATDEYASHPRRKPGELVNAGFHAPPFMVAKMKKLMTQIATDPDISDEQLLERATAKMQSAVTEQSNNTVTDKPRYSGNNERNVSRRGNNSVARKGTEHTQSSEGITLDETSDEKSDEKRSELNEQDSESKIGTITHREPDEMSLINEIKLQDDAHISPGHQEHDSLVDAGSVEEDDLGSLLHGVNLNSLVREFEMEAACVAAAAAAAEAVEGNCDEVVGNVRGDVCDDEVSQLGGLLALAEDCAQVTSDSSDAKDNK